jgi:hypothetical protein
MVLRPGPENRSYARRAGACRRGAVPAHAFFVLVGDRQVDDLDEELELTADTEIRALGNFAGIERGPER